MKDFAGKVIRTILYKVIGIENFRSFSANILKIAKIDILKLAYEQMGISKYQNEYVSGEHFVMKSVLRSYFQNDCPVIFDAGANIGHYSSNLRAIFPNATIYAFEPVPHTFKLLCDNLKDLNIGCYSLGLSSKTGRQKIYNYAHDDANGVHASLYKEVFSDLHRGSDVAEFVQEFTTLDNFCEVNKIEKIDFLKIDTEGHEFEILKGSSQMLAAKKIDIIQFEFNEMNIISRVFLKDFYEILSGYHLYRLDSQALIPLFEYRSINEIFHFQNFLAIRKDKDIITNEGH